MTPEWIHYVTGPVVGAAIGWLTNGIAIKMLFKPLHAKYIFGIRMPFTPGIIPKEKDRIGRAIGNVAETLVSEEALRRTLLSPEMKKRINEAVDGFISRQATSDETLREFITGFISDDELDDIIEKGRIELADAVFNRVSDSEFCKNVSLSIVNHIQERIANIPAMGKVLASLGGIIRGAVATVIAKSVSQILKGSSRDVVYRISGSESNSLLAKKMSELVAENSDNIAAVRNRIMTSYERLVRLYMPKALRSVNIATIVERSVSEMDVGDVEKMLLQVMDKELKAIIALGALLGFVMGLINTFV